MFIVCSVCPLLVRNAMQWYKITPTVAVMPECDEVDVQIDAKDIEMSTCTVDSVVLEVRM